MLQHLAQHTRKPILGFIAISVAMVQSKPYLLKAGAAEIPPKAVTPVVRRRGGDGPFDTKEMGPTSPNPPEMGPTSPNPPVRPWSIGSLLKRRRTVQRTAFPRDRRESANNTFTPACGCQKKDCGRRKNERKERLRERIPRDTFDRVFTAPVLSMARKV